MNTAPSDTTLRRAELLGQQGQQWLADLQAVVTQTLEDFGLTFIDTLPDGSESLSLIHI